MSASSGKLRVFISWSLPLSKTVATILRDWLPRVIQDVDPWISSEDIEKGTYWNEQVNKGLRDATVGIIVVTPANSDRPWLNFEAGALTNAIQTAGGVVAPLLINMGGASIEGPMTSLQLTRFDDKDDVIRLLDAINARTRAPLKDEILRSEFELKWPQLLDRVGSAIKNDPGYVERQPVDIPKTLEEILSTVRQMATTAQGTRGFSVAEEELIHMLLRSILYGPDFPRDDVQDKSLSRFRYPLSPDAQEYLKRRGQRWQEQHRPSPENVRNPDDVGGPTT